VLALHNVISYSNYINSNKEVYTMYAVYANFNNAQNAAHASNAKATKLAVTADPMQAVAIFKAEQIANKKRVALVCDDTGEVLA